MSRFHRRVDRIRKDVPVDDLLSHYGYRIVPGMGREQQFSCDLHGDGTDGKPSGRYYPESNSWYCFACRKARDPIQTVREKEGCDFGTALSFLEAKYNLPPLPWEEGDSEQDTWSLFRPESPDPESHKNRAKRCLQSALSERSLSFEESMSYLIEYNRILSVHWNSQREVADPQSAIYDLDQYRRSLLDRLSSVNSGS